MKKHILSVIMAVAVVILASCSKSSDPTPAATTQSNLQKVQASLIGTWTFQSLTITQTSSKKTATTTNCAALELFNAKFTDNNWKPLTPEFKYVYSSGSNAQVSNLCGSGSGGIILTVNSSQNTDGTVTLIFSNGVNYNINVADITSTSIKASIINSFGYVAIITYTRS